MCPWVCAFSTRGYAPPPNQEANEKLPRGSQLFLSESASLTSKAGCVSLAHRDGLTGLSSFVSLVWLKWNHWARTILNHCRRPSQGSGHAASWGKQRGGYPEQVIVPLSARLLLRLASEQINLKHGFLEGNGNSSQHPMGSWGEMAFHQVAAANYIWNPFLLKEGGKSYSTSEAAPFCLVAPCDICCLLEVPFAQTTIERFLLIEQGAAFIKCGTAQGLPLCQILYSKEPSSAASESDKLAKLILLRGKGASSRSNQWQIEVWCAVRRKNQAAHYFRDASWALRSKTSSASWQLYYPLGTAAPQPCVSDCPRLGAKHRWQWGQRQELVSSRNQIFCPAHQLLLLPSTSYH